MSNFNYSNYKWQRTVLKNNIETALIYTYVPSTSMVKNSTTYPTQVINQQTPRRMQNGSCENKADISTTNCHNLRWMLNFQNKYFETGKASHRPTDQWFSVCSYHSYSVLTWRHINSPPPPPPPSTTPPPHPPAPTPPTPTPIQLENMAANSANDIFECISVNDRDRSHRLNQWWPTSLVHICVTKLRWVKKSCNSMCISQYSYDILYDKKLPIILGFEKII